MLPLEKQLGTLRAIALITAFIAILPSAAIGLVASALIGSNYVGWVTLGAAYVVIIVSAYAALIFIAWSTS